MTLRTLCCDGRLSEPCLTVPAHAGNYDCHPADIGNASEGQTRACSNGRKLAKSASLKMKREVGGRAIVADQGQELPGRYQLQRLGIQN